MIGKVQEIQLHFTVENLANLIVHQVAEGLTRLGDDSHLGNQGLTLTSQQQFHPGGQQDYFLVWYAQTCPFHDTLYKKLRNHLGKGTLNQLFTQANLRKLPLHHTSIEHIDQVTLQDKSTFFDVQADSKFLDRQSQDFFCHRQNIWSSNLWSQ